MSALESPTVTVHTSLQSWAEYMQSEEQHKEKVRVQKLDTGEEEAVKEKGRQASLKMRVHALRNQWRDIKGLERTNASHSRSWHQQQPYEHSLSGGMGKALTELTKERGYGKLPLEGRILQPRR